MMGIEQAANVSKSRKRLELLRNRVKLGCAALRVHRFRLGRDT